AESDGVARQGRPLRAGGFAGRDRARDRGVAAGVARALRRAAFRVPVLLHRAGIRGLERVLGIDWLLLTTTGRRSGRPHVVMLDAVGHDPVSDTFYVQPADGRRADWVRNVAATPDVIAEARGRRFEARVEDVT